jgi:hypothetical protein
MSSSPAPAKNNLLKNSLFRQAVTIANQKIIIDKLVKRLEPFCHGKINKLPSFLQPFEINSKIDSVEKATDILVKNPEYVMHVESEYLTKEICNYVLSKTGFKYINYIPPQFVLNENIIDLLQTGKIDKEYLCYNNNKELIIELIKINYLNVFEAFKFNPCFEIFKIIVDENINYFLALDESMLSKKMVDYVLEKGLSPSLLNKNIEY